MMKELLDNFLPINSKETITLQDVVEKEYYIILKINNAIKTHMAVDWLDKNLSGVEYEIESNLKGIEIKISKIDLPEIISAREMLGSYRKDKILLGLGHFGLHYINLEERLSLAVFGNPGMGKSSMLGFLLSQFLSQGVGEHYIVDGKGVDFSQYKNHPNVLDIIMNPKEVISLLRELGSEMEERARVFREAFEEPPKSMREYEALVKEYGRDDLPKFKDIFLWVDEAHKYFPLGYGNSRENLLIHDLLEKVLREGRSFGVSIILGTHRLGDIGSSLRSLISQKIIFYQPMNSGLFEGAHLMEGMQKCIRGRMVYFSAEGQEIIPVQTPYFNSRDALAVSYKSELAKKKEKKVGKKIEVSKERENENQEN